MLRLKSFLVLLETLEVLPLRLVVLVLDDPDGLLEGPAAREGLAKNALGGFQRLRLRLSLPQDAAVREEVGAWAGALRVRLHVESHSIRALLWPLLGWSRLQALLCILAEERRRLGQ